MASNAQFPVIQNQASTLVRVITTSPLARIFHPYADIKPFLDDPKLVYEKKTKKDFKVMIQSSWASQEFITHKPYMIDSGVANSLVGVSNERMSGDNAGSGLVYFDVPKYVEASLTYAKETGKALPKDIQAKLESSMERIEKLSHDRVLSHCKKLYNSLIASRNAVKEQGGTPQQPNDLELLVAYVLKEEVKKAKGQRDKLAADFEETAEVIGGEANALL